MAAESAKIPINFQLGERLIDAATIRPPSFASFANCIAEAHKMTQPAAFSARLLRVRMSRQVAYHVNGAMVQITPEEVLRLPLPDFYKIVNDLDRDEGKPGKIVRDGDGISVAGDGDTAKVRSHEFAVLPAAAADRRSCVAPAAEEGGTRRMGRMD